jgi:hypothetical protein
VAFAFPKPLISLEKFMREGEFLRALFQEGGWEAGREEGAGLDFAEGLCGRGGFLKEYFHEGGIRKGLPCSGGGGGGGGGRGGGRKGRVREGGRVGGKVGEEK